MDDPKNLGANSLKGVANLIQVEHVPPALLQDRQLSAGPSRDVDHSLAEIALAANDHAVARFDQVDHARLHSCHPRRADGECQRIPRAVGLPEHLLGFGHQFEELRIEMAQEGRGHRARARADERRWGRGREAGEQEGVSWPGIDIEGKLQSKAKNERALSIENYQLKMANRQRQFRTQLFSFRQLRHPFLDQFADGF